MSYKALIHFVWQFIRPHKGAFSVIFLVSLVWSLDATLWPYILRLIIDTLTKFDSERGLAWAALKYPVFGGLGLWIGVEIGFRCQGFLLAKALPKLEAEMRMHMFNHIQHHSPRYFNEHFAGSLSNKITDMTTQISLIIQQMLTVFVPAFAACILSIFFFSQVNPYFAAILGGWILIHFALCIAFTRKCVHYENAHGESRSALLGKIVDSLTNNFAVNLFYRFVHERKFISAFQQKEMDRNYQAKRYAEYMRLTLGIATFLGAGVAVNGLMLYYWIKGGISTGEVAQLFNTTWNVTMILWIAGSSIPALFQSVGISKQALTVMQDHQDVVDPHHAKPLVVSKGQIVFDGVSFQYGERKLFQDKDAFIQGGEKIGLVGYSGAGKSTFVSLILRFHPIEKGKIFIDGQDISNVTLESLRRQVALIPQDPILFHRSLKENIRYSKPEATDEDVAQAAKLAHCEEFIRKLPEGYDTLVGERGTKLSGGERQRIAIARAILSNAPILILDEATSSLDSVTEKYIQESLERLMKNRTTIVIAHRLSTLSKMDRILVFDKGNIIEEGSHKELLTKQGGHYANLWQKQIRGFLPEALPFSSKDGLNFSAAPYIN